MAWLYGRCADLRLAAAVDREEDQMKFRNPETGEVFPFAFLAWRSFCKGRKCEGCSIRTPMQEGGYAPHCDYFICEHPHEAARLMGYEVVEDDMLEPTKHKELGSDTRLREMRKESGE